MRAIRLALAFAILWAPIADAKVMVCFERASATDLTAPSTTRMIEERHRKITIQTMNTFGVDYVEIPAKAAKASFVAAGAQTWLFGTGGAYAETFDGAVIGHFNGTLTNATGFVRADSLTLTRTGYVPQVPQLIITNSAAGYNDTNSPALYMNDAATCSTGISSAYGPGGLFSLAAYRVGETNPLTFGSYVMNFLPNSTPPAGGLRKHLGAHWSNYLTRRFERNTECSWCDSLPSFSSNPDTLYMWERPWSHRSDAKPQVFVSAGGPGGPADSSCNLGVPTDCLAPAEGEPFMILAGLARLDSLTGGRVFDGLKIPVKVAITIDGGFAHNARRHPVGFLVSDSTTLKATIDSLAALNIPAALGVNLDSVATYPNEKGWWDNWTKLRYTPQMWNGVSDTTVANGVPSFLRPVDVWGRYRNRAALGDTTTHSGADSSIYKLLRGALYKADSIFGASKVSRFALAPDDDWSPKGLHGSRLSPPMDSVFLAARLAGFKGLRINVQNLDGDPGYLRTNPKGYVREQGRYLDSRKQPFNLLGHSGFPIAGAVTTMATFQDSAQGSAPDSNYIPLINTNIRRAWMQITTDEDRDWDVFPYDFTFNSPSPSFGQRPYVGVDFHSHDVLYPIRRGAILRFCVNDFSGNPNGPPARMGWWVIKSLKNQFDVINSLAGRTIIEFAYPEDITP